MTPSLYDTIGCIVAFLIYFCLFVEMMSDKPPKKKRRRGGSWTQDDARGSKPPED